jgi:hypothetical protein
MEGREPVIDKTLMGDPKMSRKFNAMLGLGALAAFGFASSAFAQCPSSPVPPWSAAPAFQGAVSIATGGYDSTSCRLDAVINAGASSAAFALVQDNTPDTEPTYRAQFLVNLDNLTNLGLLETAQIFAVNGPNHLGRNQPVVLSIFGTAGTRFLSIKTVNEGAAGNISSTSTALAAGVNRIEIAWEAGASSNLRVWVNNTVEATPTVTIPNLNNAGWQGIDTAFLGLSAPSPGFVTAQAGKTVGFDEFDSRRQTFIGN